MEEAWVKKQKRTFTAFINSHLKERELAIKNICTDLSDGIALVSLIEIISGKPIGAKINRQPKLRIHKVNNCSVGFTFLNKEKVALVNIGPEDIVDGKTALILGLVWTLILRYQIAASAAKSAHQPQQQQANKSGDDSTNRIKQELLAWVQGRVNNKSQYPGVNVTNFTSTWADGLALAALVDSLKSGVIDVKSLVRENHLENLKLAIDAAEEHLKIPRLIEPADMVPEPEERSMMTLISFFRDRENDMKEEHEREYAKWLDEKRKKKLKALNITLLVASESCKEGIVGQPNTFFIKAKSGVDDDNNAVPLVEKGALRNVEMDGKKWSYFNDPDGGFARCSGINNYLLASGKVTGEFRMVAEMKIDNLEQSGVGFLINDSVFGFSSVLTNNFFVQGELFASFGTDSVEPDTPVDVPQRTKSQLIEEGKKFKFEVLRTKTYISFAVNDFEVLDIPMSPTVELELSFRPWKSILSIAEWTLFRDNEDLVNKRILDSINNRNRGKQAEKLNVNWEAILEETEMAISVQPSGDMFALYPEPEKQNPAVQVLKPEIFANLVEVSFTPPRIGEYRVEVKFAGSHLRGSPFVSKIAEKKQTASPGVGGARGARPANEMSNTDIFLLLKAANANKK